MPVAEIIAIGTEILLGEIQDTNTRYLARKLRDAGVDLYRTMVVGDNIDRIAGAIQESMQRAQIIITTGGLGPTVDDPTRQAVAQAVGVGIEFRPELWEQIQNRFQRFNRQATGNNRRQAYTPAGAIAVENAVGTAPAFIVETGRHAIISLPGVPREMEYLYENKVLPYLQQRFQLSGIIKALVLHTAGVGESWVDDLIGDLETNPNPTVGLLAHSGQVDIRVTAKADTAEEANRQIAAMAAEIRSRLGDNIYGEDEDTLETVIAARVNARGAAPAVVECGLGGELLQRLRTGGCSLAGTLSITEPYTAEQIKEVMQRLKDEFQPPVLLGTGLQPGPEKQVLTLVLWSPDGEQEIMRSYGGPPAMGPAWAVNTALDFLRRGLK